MRYQKERTWDDYDQLGVRLEYIRFHLLHLFADEFGHRFPKSHPGMKSLEEALDKLLEAKSKFDDQFVADGLWDESKKPKHPMYPRLKGAIGEGMTIGESMIATIEL